MVLVAFYFEKSIYCVKKLVKKLKNVLNLNESFFLLLLKHEFETVTVLKSNFNVQLSSAIIIQNINSSNYFLLQNNKLSCKSKTKDMSITKSF